MTAAEWQKRMERAERLSADCLECRVCGGTGGRPKVLEQGRPPVFHECKTCHSTGLASIAKAR
jgi:hypothetical protein